MPVSTFDVTNNTAIKQLIFTLILILMQTYAMIGYGQKDRAGKDHFVLTSYSGISPRNLFVGDRIRLKLVDGMVHKGTLTGIEPDYLNLLTHETIRISIDSINWIKRTKPSTSGVVVGSLFIAAGLGLGYLATYNMFEAEGPKYAVFSDVAYIIGIAIIIPPKYRLRKESQLKFVVGIQ